MGHTLSWVCDSEHGKGCLSECVGVGVGVSKVTREIRLVQNTTISQIHFHLTPVYTKESDLRLPFVKSCFGAHFGR